LCRALLRPLASTADIWCQLFSEPGAGSDLAGLATRAVRDGDEWIVNGQKVWSSGAHMADYGLLMARTDPVQPKHRGITYFILDMHADGVDVRPLKQITGGAEFNEVFLSDVVVPDSMRLGPINEGWRVSTTTLMHERTGLSEAPQVGRGQVDRLIGDAKENGKWNDPVLRDHLIKLVTEERALQMTNLRGYASREAGKPPGPEGSITKLLLSSLSQRIANAALDIRGLAALADADYGPDDREFYARMAEGARLPDSLITRSFLASRSQTIRGGTSEIQRNIIGERVLGLPKDADPWKDRAWKEIPRETLT
jgi:alkylation response protein AidB-like acyl-CoA dehydrogenase